MSLPKEVQQLLDDVIDSLVKWDLIAYMQKKPNDRISSEKLASEIGRSAHEVIQALSELSSCDVVQYEDDGEAIYYRFCPSKIWHQQIGMFNEASNDRNTRWLILNYLVEKHGVKQFG